MRADALRAIAACFPYNAETRAVRQTPLQYPPQLVQPQDPAEVAAAAAAAARVPLAFIAAHPAARLAAEQRHVGCRIGDLHLRLCTVHKRHSSGSGTPRGGGAHAKWCCVHYASDVCGMTSCAWCGACCCGGDNDGDVGDSDSDDDDEEDVIVTRGVVRQLSLCGIAYVHALPRTAWWLRRAPVPPLAVILRHVSDTCVLYCVSLLPSLTRLCLHACELMRELRFAPAAPTTLRDVHIKSNLIEDVSVLAVCGIRALSLDCPRVGNVNAFAEQTQLRLPGQRRRDPQRLLRVLDVRNCAAIKYPHVFQQMSSLRSFSVSVNTLDSITFAAHCGGGFLRVLRLFGTRVRASVSERNEYDEWARLGILYHLRKLVLVGCRLPTLSWLRTCAQLRHAELRDCYVAQADYDALGSSLDDLCTLQVYNCNMDEDVTFLQRCVQLSVLKLFGCAAVRNMQALSVLCNLTVLWCSASDMTDINWLSACEGMTELRLHSCARLHDMSGLAALRQLRVLILALTPVSDLSSLAHCRALTVLDIALCPGVRDLSVVGTLTRLQRLYLPGCAIATIDWIVYCTALEEVVLEGCARIRDFTPLRTLPRLRLVSLLHCNPEALRSLMQPTTPTSMHTHSLPRS